MPTDLKSGVSSRTDCHLELVEAGESLPTTSADAARQLFAKSYYRYHYISEVAATDRLRILAWSNGVISGFATVKAVGAFGILSNLVVAEQMRGQGIGKAIETLRSDVCRRKGLIPYTSCVTVGAQSQFLKLQVGLVGINVKYGYRQDVFAPSDVSSAVTFSNPDISLDEPARDAIAIDRVNKRIRLLTTSAKALRRQLIETRHLSDYYVDMLCPISLAEELLMDRYLAFQGVDYMPSLGLRGVMFQIKNSAFTEGIAGEPDFAVAPKTIFATALKSLGLVSGHAND